MVISHHDSYSCKCNIFLEYLFFSQQKIQKIIDIINFMNNHFSILVIDDEPIIRNGIESILTQEFGENVAVLQAKDGKMGFDKAMTEKPDFMISDIVMPEITGLDLLENLKKCDIEIPTIMISGYDEFKYAQKALKLGAINYILKPINKEELIETIRKSAQTRTSMEDTNETFRHDAIAHFLNRLITGELKSEGEIKRIQATLQLEFKGSSYIVVSVNAADEDKEKLRERLDEANLMHISISNLMIIVFASDESYAIHETGLLLRDINAVAGTGLLIDTLSKLNLSYQHSLQTLSYSIYYPEDKIITRQFITNGKPNITPAEIDTVSLRNMLIENNKEEINAWINSFYRQITMSGTLPPPSFIKGMSIFVLSDIQKALTENLAIPKELFLDMNASVLNTIYRFEELKEWLQRQLMHISDVIIPEARIANMPEIHIAKKYIENNLDRIVSSNEIALKLGMNPTYFSTFFKQKTGENFRAYVNRVKNDKAKEMLAIPDLSIEEIAHSLGYTDYRSFHRIFKQMNDESPTTYRSRILKD